MRIDKNTTIKLGDRNIVKIKIGDSVIWEKSTVNYFYIQNTSEGDNTVTFKTSASKTLPSSDLYSNQVEYSTDKRNWNTLTFVKNTPQTVTISGGEKLYLRNDSGVFNHYKSFSDNFITRINTSQSCVIGGNINTLLNYNDVDVNLKDSCFYGLFRDCTSLTDVSNLELPSTTLASQCYYNMFYGCTSLINTPSLPATKLASQCYYNMFYNCTSLVSAPELPATTLADNCYNGMFQNCKSLVSAPELPVTTLANSCYNSMFRGCTSLTTAPTLPVTTLVDSCYKYMFFGCNSLTTAPTLPATTLADNCYNSMFQGCTSLTTTPELPATELANSCYSSMFQGCTSLTTTPELPATELANSCYNGMFRGCTGLTSAPELPATTLKPQCYNGMFSGCTGLTSTPTLPATKLANSCYNGMFNNCTSLVTTPSLPATNLANSCYQRMFSGCTSLINAPSLPATTLADYCYQSMFSDCTSLVNAPELPVTTLTTSCYNGMFGGCSSLVNAPELPATELVNNCYYQMFYNCSLINEVTVYADNISATNCTKNWLAGVASTGTFYNYGAATYERSPSGVPSGWTEVRPDYFYVANNYDGTNTISIKQTITGSPDSSTYAKTLQYSKDKTNWSTIILSDVEYNISLNSGEILYMRGNEGVFNYYANDGAIQAVTNILGTQTHTIGGNINTLVNYITPNELTLTQGVFAGLFQNNTTITSAENLTLQPSSDGSLSTFAYCLMFSGCSALITPPSEIPATKQGHASCGKMFLDCIQLKTPPALKSTILGNYCFTSIFKNCTSLISAPELPALTLTPNCYQSAFEGCTSLKVAPALPATEMKPNCYKSLFLGCTSLVNAPALPATVLAQSCYRALFARCTSLVNAPALPAITLADGCYQEIFQDCTSLVNPPELPATEMKPNCYRALFARCTSLVNAPALPATVLAQSCYQQLFYGCSKLNNITVYANDISATDCIFRWVYNVASKGTFHNLGSATYATDSPSGIPTGWTEVKPNEPDYFYVENTYNGTNNIYVKTRAGYSGTEPTGEFATTLEYSKDKTNWTTINLNYDYHKNGSTVVSNLVTNLTLSLSVGEKVYFRNTSGYFGYVGDNGKHSHQFSSDENIKVGGNIKSLLDYRDMVGTTMKKGCFYEMFFEANKLTDASGLILPDTVADSCYLGFFSGCYSLTSIPTLPALTMAPYCYCEMFKNTAITTPPALPSTKLAPYCYRNLFENCYSLTSSPELPATTMVEGCYQGLFNSCNKLTTAPVLPAKTLAKYSYRYMFNGCLRLNSVTSYADNISATDCTRWWLDSVASTGTFHNLGTATYEKDSIDGIPTGWTEVKS